jgi:hypothetical protein
MVSSMTFDEVAETYSRHRALQGKAVGPADARAELAEFLGVADELDEPTISTDVRIILVSADLLHQVSRNRRRQRTPG